MKRDFIVEDYWQKYAGQSIDYDRVYGAECVDAPPKHLISLCVGSHIPIHTGNAFHIFRNDTLGAWCDKIEHIAELQPADFVVWDRTVSNPTGHVAMATGFRDGRIEVIEQDGSKKHAVLTKRFRNLNNVLGIVRLKDDLVDSYYERYYKASKIHRKPNTHIADTIQRGAKIGGLMAALHTLLNANGGSIFHIFSEIESEAQFDHATAFALAIVGVALIVIYKFALVAVSNGSGNKFLRFYVKAFTSAKHAEQELGKPIEELFGIEKKA